MLFLLADDDADDQLLFLEALGEIDTSIECLVALNGEDALQKLKDRRENLPNYIFLDLNMPRMNGLQCLNEIKKMEQLHNIPVIIYTTSAAQRDIDESKKSGAEKFITKPTSFQELKNILHELVA